MSKPLAELLKSKEKQLMLFSYYSLNPASKRHQNRVVDKSERQDLFEQTINTSPVLELISVFLPFFPHFGHETCVSSRWLFIQNRPMNCTVKRLLLILEKAYLLFCKANNANFSNPFKKLNCHLSEMLDWFAYFVLPHSLKFGLNCPGYVISSNWSNC